MDRGWTYLDSSGYRSRPGSMVPKSGMHENYLKKKTPTFKDHISGNLPSNGKEDMIHIVLLCLFKKDIFRFATLLTMNMTMLPHSANGP